MSLNSLKTNHKKGLFSKNVGTNSPNSLPVELCDIGKSFLEMYGFRLSRSKTWYMECKFSKKQNVSSV